MSGNTPVTLGGGSYEARDDPKGPTVPSRLTATSKAAPPEAITAPEKRAGADERAGTIQVIEDELTKVGVRHGVVSPEVDTLRTTAVILACPDPKANPVSVAERLPAKG